MHRAVLDMFAHLIPLRWLKVWINVWNWFMGLTVPTAELRGGSSPGLYLNLNQWWWIWTLFFPFCLWNRQMKALPIFNWWLYKNVNCSTLFWLWGMPFSRLLWFWSRKKPRKGRENLLLVMLLPPTSMLLPYYYILIIIKENRIFISTMDLLSLCLPMAMELEGMGIDLLAKVFALFDMRVYLF